MHRPIIEVLESRELLTASLTGAFMGKVPTALPPGESTQVQLRLTNSGDARVAGPAQINVYASGTPNFAPDAVLLISSTRNLQLRHGQSAVIKLNLPSAQGLPDGNYYLLATVDAPSTMPSPALVVSDKTVSIAQPFVDLSGTILAQPRTAFVSDVFAGRGQTRIRVVNQGNATAKGPMQITVYASAGGGLDSSAVQIGVAVVRNINIKAGGARTVVAQVLVPPGTAIGNYTILAAINSAHTVPETDTSNNLAVGAQSLAVLNRPTVGNVPHHGHGGGSGGVFIGGGGSTYIDVTGYGDGYVDSGPSGGGYVATSPADGGSSYSDSGFPTTAPVDNSPPADSGDSSDGSDFGSDPGDPGGGADF